MNQSQFHWWIQKSFFKDRIITIVQSIHISNHSPIAWPLRMELMALMKDKRFIVQFKTNLSHLLFKEKMELNIWSIKSWFNTWNSMKFLLFLFVIYQSSKAFPPAKSWADQSGVQYNLWTFWIFGIIAQR